MSVTGKKAETVLLKLSVLAMEASVAIIARTADPGTPAGLATPVAGLVGALECAVARGTPTA